MVGFQNEALAIQIILKLPIVAIAANNSTFRANVDATHLRQTPPSRLLSPPRKTATAPAARFACNAQQANRFQRGGRAQRQSPVPARARARATRQLAAALVALAPKSRALVQRHWALAQPCPRPMRIGVATKKMNYEEIIVFDKRAKGKKQAARSLRGVRPPCGEGLRIKKPATARPASGGGTSCPRPAKGHQR